MDRPEIAPPAGYPHLKYAQIERERRWLCTQMPEEAISAPEIFEIVDYYLPDSALRLRSAAPLHGGVDNLRLSKKTQLADPRHRLITTIYLSESEYAQMRVLGGLVLKKHRHSFSLAGRRISVDRFDAPLAGLVLAEVEFDDDETMSAYPSPPFAIREVTHDAHFTGFALAQLAAAGAPDLAALTGDR
ncbi:MAG: hypothetical protein WA943_13290 [Parvibaculum sp.]|uniref:hypothetical protein n=1 Tax=Parvibaculum sp. TaxID=2024848 RepID=UPI003C781034